MHKLNLVAAAVVAIAITATASAFAQEYNGMRRTIKAGAPPNGTPLTALVEAMPNGADILMPYATAKTISQVKSANALLRKEITQGRSVESYLGKIHLIAMESCQIADQIDRGPIDAIISNARAFKSTADDIDGRIRKSLADMKRALDHPGAGAYRLRHEVEEYDGTYAEFAQLHLEIQEMMKGLDTMAATMPDAKAICRPGTIPPLISTNSLPKTDAVEPRYPTAPLNIFDPQPLNILNPHL